MIISGLLDGINLRIISGIALVISLGTTVGLFQRITMEIGFGINIGISLGNWEIFRNQRQTCQQACLYLLLQLSAAAIKPLKYLGIISIIIGLN